MGNKDCEIYHYGVKGMKWGVRRTPAQLGHKKTGSKTKEKAEKKKIDKPNKSVKEIGYAAINKGAEIVATYKTYSLLDDIFLGGKGKQTIGRAATAAWLRANGYKKVKFM